jgi:ParB family chromosome partitioning protein
MSEKSALGRGLGSLIPSRSNKGSQSGELIDCNIEDVIPNQNQPRKLFDKAAIDELAQSIEEKGLLQPLVVRKMGGGKYELIAGERRLRASKQAHLKTIPVIVKDIESDEVLELALIENIQRQDLNPVEEALAYRDLLNKYQYTQEELAKKLGKDRSSIANSLRLLKLPEQLRAYLIAGKLSMGHARALLSIDNVQMQKKLCEEIISNELSVREVESLVSKAKNSSDENQSVSGSTSTKSSSGANESMFKGLEEEMKKSLKTKVMINSPTGKKGKVIIYFHNPQELDNLYHQITGTL